MGRKTNISLWLIISIFLFAMVGTTFARQIFVDVDATGNNDGSSWANAYNCLQDALAAASSGDEILVAKGIYKPDKGSKVTPKDRKATFQLLNDVVIKGGYAGSGEADPTARNINENETILSGDLNGDDDPNFVNNGENSYNVVTGMGTDNTAVLNGFTITGGNAIGNGGGMHNYRGSPTLTKCTFKANLALLGGGMYNDQSNPTLVDCTFSGNRAGDSGGGMYNSTSSPTLNNCTFSKNSALNGGGIHCKYDSNPMLTNCTFNENSARYSGGMANYLSSNPTLTNCTFSGNSANYGGGMRNYNSSPTLTNCTFINNSASSDGGGINNNSSSPKLISCFFSGNLTAGYGGGIRNYESSPTLTGCTFSGNSAEKRGGGMSNLEKSNPTITNCILWLNSDSGGVSEPAQIHTSGSTPVVNYCCIQGWTGTLDGTGNINADPLFADLAKGNYHLSPESPCIDAGDPNYVAAAEETDIDSEPRIIKDHIDIGADEYNNQHLVPSVYPTIQSAIDAGDPNYVAAADETNIDSEPRIIKDHIDIGADEYNNQRLVPSVYPTIQSAIDAAYNGDIIVISPGAHVGIGNRDIDFKGKAITVRSTNPTERDVVAATIINCGNEGRGFYFHSGEDANSIVNGLAIINGNATNGGGVYCKDSSPTVKNCIFGSNSAKSNGGGMYNNSSSPTITNCTFSGNLAYYSGGGIHNYNSSPALNNCTFKGNWAKYGGGIHNQDGSSPTLRNCMFSKNETNERGGGMNNYDSSPTLTYCTFSKNSAKGNGGGMFNEGGNATLTNCTFVRNQSLNNGGGMFTLHSRVTLTNCTFGGNSSNDHGGGMFNGSGSPILTKCTFRGNSASSDAGGMYNREGSPILTNCIFSGNLANSNGGAMFNNSSPTLTNCTFSANLAEVCGGLYNDSSSFNCKPTLTNCIFWDNRDSGEAIESAQIYGGIPAVTYTCVQETSPNDPNAYPGLGNIDENPCFVKPGYWANSDDPNVPAKLDDPNAIWIKANYHLRPDSPCIDAGDPNSDFSQEPQPNGGRVNMGTYGNTPEATSKGTADTRTQDSDNLASKNLLQRTFLDYVYAITTKVDHRASLASSVHFWF